MIRGDAIRCSDGITGGRTNTFRILPEDLAFGAYGLGLSGSVLRTTTVSSRTHRSSHPKHKCAQEEPTTDDDDYDDDDDA